MSGRDNGGDTTRWPAKDARKEYGGSGARPRSGQGRKAQKKWGKETCPVCLGICCQVSRELIAKAFGLGCINVSPKVCYSLGL